MKIPNIYKQVSTKGLVEKNSSLNSRGPHTAAMRYLYRVHLQGCLRRSVTNLITIDDYAHYSQQVCTYCGGPPVNMTKLKSTINIPYNGVDKIDNNRPYEIGNISTCCKYCNSMKSKLGANEFIQHVIKIAKYQQSIA